MKLTNRKVREYVMRNEAFTASNIFAEHHAGAYVVYSYGHHFPMYIHHAGTWYRNVDKYSVTTSKHQGQARPFHVDFVDMHTDQMRRLVIAAEHGEWTKTPDSTVYHVEVSR